MSKIFVGIIIVVIVILIIKSIGVIGFQGTFLLAGLIGAYIAFSHMNYTREQADIQHKANELEKLSTVPKEYETILNGIKADNIVCWEDYLRDIDDVTVYIDDSRKIVRIITE